MATFSPVRKIMRRNAMCLMRKVLSYTVPDLKKSKKCAKRLRELTVKFINDAKVKCVDDIYGESRLYTYFA